MPEPVHHYFGLVELEAYAKGHRLVLQRVPRREGSGYRAQFGCSGRLPLLTVAGATVQATLDALEAAILASDL